MFVRTRGRSGQRGRIIKDDGPHDPKPYRVLRAAAERRAAAAGESRAEEAESSHPAYAGQLREAA